MDKFFEIPNVESVRKEIEKKMFLREKNVVKDILGAIKTMVKNVKMSEKICEERCNCAKQNLKESCSCSKKADFIANVAAKYFIPEGFEISRDVEYEPNTNLFSKEKLIPRYYCIILKIPTRGNKL